MNWKPLVASLVVIALALAVMAYWQSARKQPGSAGGNAAETPDNRESPAETDEGLQWVWTKLEDLPALDPLGLWPRNGQRVASPQFNVMWETTEHSECRLLVTRDGKDWYSMGRTGGTRHFLPLNFADFESELTFAVEFVSQGVHYRSTPRRVSFGRGAYFQKRECWFEVEGTDHQFFELEVLGRDPAGMPGNAFSTGWFPIELVVGAAPGESGDERGTVQFLLSSPMSQSPVNGYLEMYDAVGNTYDRVLISLATK